MKKYLLYPIVSLAVTSTFAACTNLIVSDNSESTPQQSISTSSPIANDNSIVTSTSNKVEVTPQMKFMNGLLEAGNIDLNATIDMEFNNNNIKILLNGTVSYYDLENIKANGTLEVKYNELDTAIGFTYIDSYLYVSTSFMNAKVNTSSMIAGIKDLLPIIGVDIGDLKNNMPSIDLDLNAIVDELSALNFESSEIGYKTNLKINDEIKIDLYVDTDYKLKKVEIDELKINDITLSLSADTLIHTENDKVQCPESEENTYDDYTSFTSFIENAYNLFNQHQFSFAVDLDLRNGENELISLNSDLAFDMSTHDFYADASVNYNQKAYDIFAQYDNAEGVYFTLNDLIKGKLTNENITKVNDIIEGYLNSDIVTYVQNKLDELINSKEFENVKELNLNEIIDIIKNVSYKGNNVIIDLDIGHIIDNACSLTVKIENSTKAISKVEISDFTYGDFNGTLSIDIKEYQGLKEINKEEFEDYAPILTIYDEIKLLTQQTQFAFNFDATIINGEKNYALSGYIQFALDKIETEEGVIEDNKVYANVVVDDGVSNHTITLDMHNDDIRLAYQNRNVMYGSIKLSTIKSMMNSISELFDNENNLMNKITSLIPSGEETTILSQLLNKNFENLSLDLLKGFSIGETSAHIVLAKELLGINGDLDLNINYTNDKLLGIDINNLILNDLTLDLSVELATYDEELGLADDHNYLDLNLLKILLDYGVPTINNEYFHLMGALNLKLSIGELKITDFKIDLDIKIRNNNGEPEIFIDLPYIPIIGVTDYSNKLPSKISSNSNSKYKSSNMFIKDSKDINRHATIYIYDGNVYLERSETAYFYSNNGTMLFNPKTETYTRAVKTTLSDFGENIYTYLLSDVLGVTDTLMNLILKETGNGSTAEQMEFDKLISELSYNDLDRGLTIGLDMSAITGNDSISGTSVTLYHSEGTENPHLEKVSIKMNISSMIDISGEISLVDYGESFDPQFIYDYCSSYGYGEGRYSSHSA